MRIHRRKRRRVADSSASSDLAFLLIIYFIVIAGFNVNKGFLMTLPAKNSTRFILKDDLLRLELDAAGRLRYRGEVLLPEEAAQYVAAALREHPNMAMLLEVDGQAPWQGVVSYVEMAQKTGVTAFSFTLKPEEGEKKP